MEIRRLALTDDLDLVGRIVQQAYFGLAGYPHDPEYDLEIADVASRRESSDVVVGVLDGRVVACLTFVGDPTSPHAEHGDADAATFRYFGVEPQAQGRGIGEEMVRWCIAEAARAGRLRLRIHTLEVMAGAQRLYERLGFVRDPAFDEQWDSAIGLAYRYDIVPGGDIAPGDDIAPGV